MIENYCILQYSEIVVLHQSKGGQKKSESSRLVFLVSRFEEDPNEEAFVSASGHNDPGGNLPFRYFWRGEVVAHETIWTKEESTSFPMGTLSKGKSYGVESRGWRGMASTGRDGREAQECD